MRAKAFQNWYLTRFTDEYIAESSDNASEALVSLEIYARFIISPSQGKDDFYYSEFARLGKLIFKHFGK